MIDQLHSVCEGNTLPSILGRVLDYTLRCLRRLFCLVMPWVASPPPCLFHKPLEKQKHSVSRESERMGPSSRIHLQMSCSSERINDVVPKLLHHSFICSVVLLTFWGGVAGTTVLQPHTDSCERPCRQRRCCKPLQRTSGSSGKLSATKRHQLTWWMHV
jgi:hypothetical protein